MPYYSVIIIYRGNKSLKVKQYFQILFNLVSSHLSNIASLGPLVKQPML